MSAKLVAAKAGSGHPVKPGLPWFVSRPVNPPIKSGEGDDEYGIEMSESHYRGNPCS
jgi:hypothetical protein